MKRHYQNFLLNSTNNTPASDVRVHVFLADQVTKAQLEGSLVSNNNILFDVESDDYAYIGISSSQLVTNYTTTETEEILTTSKGFFDFWISDKGASGDIAKGYNQSTRFTIAFVKKGLNTTVLENVEIFQPYYEIDETDTNTRKNKTVNNNLLYNSETHRNKDYNSSPHNIGLLDETADNSESDWETKNKLMSNKLFVELQDSVDINAADINVLESEIASLSGGAGGLTGRVETLESEMDDVEDDILANQTDINTLNLNYVALDNKVDGIESDVENNETNIQLNSEDIQDNTSAIANLRTDFENINYFDLNSDVNWLSASIDNNVDNINVLISDVQYLKDWTGFETDTRSLSGVEYIELSTDLDNHTWNGIITEEYVYERVYQYDPLYYSPSLSAYGRADATDWNRMPVETLALSGAGANEKVRMLHYGMIRNYGWSWSESPSARQLYASDIIGGMSNTQSPSASGSLVQVLGFIRSLHEIKWNPSTNVMENT